MIFISTFIFIYYHYCHENAKVLFSKYLLCSFVDNEKQLLVGKIRYAAVQIRNVNQRSLFKHLH